MPQRRAHRRRRSGAAAADGAPACACRRSARRATSCGSSPGSRPRARASRRASRCSRSRPTRRRSRSRRRSSGTLLAVVCDGRARPSPPATVVGWIGEPGEQIPADEAAGPEGPGDAGRAHARAGARHRPRPVLTGSGPGGRVERRDVLAAVEPAAAARRMPSRAPAGDRAAADARRRRSRSSRVSRTTDARRALPAHAGGAGRHLTHLLLRASPAALRAHPEREPVWVDDGPRFRRARARADVGLAIAARRQRSWSRRSPSPICLEPRRSRRADRRVVEEARARTARRALSGPAAITLSNLGMFGVDRFEAIVDPDQTAILAAGRGHRAARRRRRTGSRRPAARPDAHRRPSRRSTAPSPPGSCQRSGPGLRPRSQVATAG